MAEIEEVFQDMGDNIKKTFKNKPFLIAAAGVAAVALGVAYFRSKKASTENADAGTLYYSGYPTISGGAAGEDMTGVNGFDNSVLNDIYNQMDALQGAYSDTMSGMQENIISLSEQLTTSQAQTEAQQLALEKQQAITQMKANSDLYNISHDADLHKQNLAIAEKYGFSFDSVSGNYFDENGVVYTTAQQVAGKSGTGSTQVSYDVNRDYQAEINKALLNGSSATVINNLNAQRAAKIQGTGATSTANTTYDKNLDYSALIVKAQQAGAAQSVIDNLTAQRNAKIKGENLNSDGTKK